MFPKFPVSPASGYSGGQGGWTVGREGSQRTNYWLTRAPTNQKHHYTYYTLNGDYTLNILEHLSLYSYIICYVMYILPKSPPRVTYSESRNILRNLSLGECEVNWVSKLEYVEELCSSCNTHFKFWGLISPPHNINYCKHEKKIRKRADTKICTLLSRV